MGTSMPEALAFYGLAGLALVGAAWVAFSKNIVRSAFALLLTFFGVAGLYALLAAEVVAVIQLMVYVGGVLVVMLFAVMLTARIDEARASNKSLGKIAGFAAVLPLAAGLVWIAVDLPLPVPAAPPEPPTAAAIGDAMLGAYVLPFEAISVLLIAALIGAVVLSRGWRNVSGEQLGEDGEP
jgi:NAD(P)H-quinone oxidoreductase subunit 6